VVRGHRGDSRRAPRPKDLALLVEVSDQTYAKDRGPKLGRYASARVPCYWIVNLSKKQVEVYRDPKGRGACAHYASIETFTASADLPVVIDGHALGKIAVRALLS